MLRGVGRQNHGPANRTSGADHKASRMHFDEGCHVDRLPLSQDMRMTGSIPEFLKTRGAGSIPEVVQVREENESAQRGRHNGVGANSARCLSLHCHVPCSLTLANSTALAIRGSFHHLAPLFRWFTARLAGRDPGVLLPFFWLSRGWERSCYVSSGFYSPGGAVPLLLLLSDLPAITRL